MNRDLVLAEWGRARMALGAAQLLTAEDYPEDAASRAYNWMPRFGRTGERVR